MAKKQQIVKRGLKDTLQLVDTAALGLGSSVSLLEEETIVGSDMSVVVRIYTKYYMRSENYASLTVVVSTLDDNQCMVSAIGAAAGSGILNISWGAEANFVNSFAEDLAQASR